MVERANINNNKLDIGDKRVEFDAPITDLVLFDEFVVVRLESTREKYGDLYRNVIAIDLDGSIRWKIPERPQPDPEVYTDVFTKDGSDLWAHNSCGMLYEVDPSAGDILDREFVK